MTEAATCATTTIVMVVIGTGVHAAIESAFLVFKFHEPLSLPFDVDDLSESLTLGVLAFLFFFHRMDATDTIHHDRCH